MNSLYCKAGSDRDKWLVKKDYAAWLPSNNRSLAGSYDGQHISTRHRFYFLYLLTSILVDELVILRTFFNQSSRMIAYSDATLLIRSSLETLAGTFPRTSRSVHRF